MGGQAGEGPAKPPPRRAGGQEPLAGTREGQRGLRCGGREAARSGVPVLGIREPEEKAPSHSWCLFFVVKAWEVGEQIQKKSRHQQKLNLSSFILAPAACLNDP